jgi:segregation and condensation protein B
MEIDKKKAVIEAILFAAGKEVNKKELMSVLEISEDELNAIISVMQEEYKHENRGIEIIKVEDSYQLATKKDLYEYLYQIFDKRNKPNLSQAALETLAIIAYNPKITRAEIESIRGVNSDGTMYKLLEYDLIESVGKLDAPGRPTMYSTTSNFLKMFGLNSLNNLPDLPKYKLDENQQIVIDDIVNTNSSEENNIKEDSIELNENGVEEENTVLEKAGKIEAPMPEREEENN